MEPGITSLTLSLPLHTIVTLGFYLMAMLYIVFSTILYYHWKEYSTDAGVTRTTLILYLVTTIPLILIMGITTLVI